MTYDPRLLSDDMREHIGFEFCWKPQLDPICWIWTGPVNNKGYGHLPAGRVHLSHRAAYRALAGEIPDGLTLDHLCRKPLCCNPAHLEPVPQAENTQRAVAARAASDDDRNEFDRFHGQRCAEVMAAILDGLGAPDVRRQAS